MCGFAGFLDPDFSGPADTLRSTADAMTAPIRHRGPDDQGIWTDPEAGVALGHRRLSILDLSPEGHQPMVSACGRYVIAYNGEIYNFQALRRDLEQAGAAPPWRGHSDTEVLLAAVAHWGIGEALERANGMFAFALWDRTTRTLHLARDRLGEKPLYYGWAGRTFLFGSDMASLRTHPDWRGEIDRDALDVMMRSNSVPAPLSIYRGVRKLLPGTRLALTPEDAHQRRLPDPVRYWSARSVAEAGRADPYTGSAEAALEELDTLLRDAVRLRMVADVPLGAFLSGGIDSSMVVALMQAQSDRPVETFTIGFDEHGFDEARYAKDVAQHLGTRHHELYVRPEEARAVIPELPTVYSEPFADSSQIPTSLVSQLARRHVTVALSGDGGDELFGGYSEYLFGEQLWQRLSRLPGPARRALAGAARAAAVPADRVRLRDGRPMGARARSLARLLDARSGTDLMGRMRGQWKGVGELVLDTEGNRRPMPLDCLQDGDFIESMMSLDLVSYLPNDILTKVDRAAMGVSLETRIPLLDPRVVAFAWRMPHAFRIRDGRGKWLLRQLLHRYVPKELVERPKQGFGVPIGQWLRGPLREWAESLLAEDRLAREGYLNPEPIRRRWAEHLQGRQNWAHDLWNVLMFQAWLEAQDLRPQPLRRSADVAAAAAPRQATCAR